MSVQKKKTQTARQIKYYILYICDSIVEIKKLWNVNWEKVNSRLFAKNQLILIHACHNCGKSDSARAEHQKKRNVMVLLEEIAGSYHFFHWSNETTTLLWSWKLEAGDFINRKIKRWKACLVSRSFTSCRFYESDKSMMNLYYIPRLQ